MGGRMWWRRAALVAVMLAGLGVVPASLWWGWPAAVLCGAAALVALVGARRPLRSQARRPARRDGRRISVAVLSLDHFDRFTDHYGRRAGDRLLKAASAAWHGRLRDIDMLARYGGGRFLVLLPGVGLDRSVAVLGRVQAVTPLGHTFSAGVATWDGAETAEALVARAGEALHAARAAGRNRVGTDGGSTRPDGSGRQAAVRGCPDEPAVGD